MRMCPLVLLAAVSCPTVAGAPSLELLSFSPGTRGVWPVHINERGDIAFNLRPASSQASPYVRWADGTLESITVHHAMPYYGLFEPRVRGLSDTGEVLIEYDAAHSTLPDRRRLYQYHRNGLTQLVADVDRSPISSSWGGGGGHAAFLGGDGSSNEGFLYLMDNNNQITFVGRPEGGTPIVSAMNDHGDTAGHLNRPGNQVAMRVTSDGSVQLLDHEHDIYGRGINNHGTVTGSMYDPNGANGAGLNTVFMWRSDMTEATFLETSDEYEGAAAFAINDSDWIVGRLYERIPNSSGGRVVQHAFVYTPETGYINLNDLFADQLDGARLILAAALNESGTIVGEAILANGDRGLFIVTIPAPSSALLLAPGALLAVRRRR